ncbi:DUF1840 domain-containing protein [Methylosoma difficile]
MLVTFSTRGYSDITLFGDIALTLLKMMGHSGNVPGAILAADVPAALNRLLTALDNIKPTPPITDKEDKEPEVSLSKRGLPLIKLLNDAVKENSNVMWK